jgi:hypothetical protein
LYFLEFYWPAAGTWVVWGAFNQEKAKLESWWVTFTNTIVVLVLTRLRSGEEGIHNIITSDVDKQGREAPGAVDGSQELQLRLRGTQK